MPHHQINPQWIAASVGQCGVPTPIIQVLSRADREDPMSINKLEAASWAD
jgi:hypothetical protein